MFLPPQDQKQEQDPHSRSLSDGQHPSDSSSSTASSSEATLGSATFEFRAPRSKHPPALASLSHTLSLTVNTFGVMPYPEWRVNVVMRAQKAGVGNVGEAMGWVLWNSGQSAVEACRNAASLRKRTLDGCRTAKGEEGAMNAVRHCQTLKVKGSGCGGDDDGGDGDSSDALSEIGMMNDSEEEGSEVEWQGWMADLYRQRKVAAQQQRVQQQADEALDSTPVCGSSLQDHENRCPYQKQLEIPQSQAHAQKLFQETRRALEPSAVVTPMFTSPFAHSVLMPRQSAPSPFSTGSTSMSLSSPSSSESLSYHRARTLSMGFSPNDSPSPATSPCFSQPQSQLQSNSSLSFPHEPAMCSALYHSTSMSGTMRSGSSVHEPPPRRPSMPILFPLQPFCPPTGSGSGSGPLNEPKSLVWTTSPTTFSFGSPQMSSSLPLSRGVLPVGPGRHSPTLSPQRGAGGAGVERTPSTSTLSYAAQGMNSLMQRRASSAGLVSVGGGGSVGRSGIIALGSGLLKKKDSDVGKEKAREKEQMKEKEKEKERERERERKEKEKRGKDQARGKEKESSRGKGKDKEKEKEKAKAGAKATEPVKATGKVQRPKLSLTTTTPHLTRQPQSPQAQSPQSIREGPGSPSENGPILLGKKTLGLVRGVSERLVRGLDPAMDFVEGR